MNVEHIKVIFEESGISMTSVSNKNDNARNNMHIMNGKVSVATRKRNKEKISSKVVRKYYDFLIEDIEMFLEERQLYAKTRNIDSDNDLLED